MTFIVPNHNIQNGARQSIFQSVLVHWCTVPFLGSKYGLSCGFLLGSRGRGLDEGDGRGLCPVLDTSSNTVQISLAIGGDPPSTAKSKLTMSDIATCHVLFLLSLSLDNLVAGSRTAVSGRPATDPGAESRIIPKLRKLQRAEDCGDQATSLPESVSRLYNDHTEGAN
jgi:hypothetical protein